MRIYIVGLTQDWENGNLRSDSNEGLKKSGFTQRFNKGLRK